MEIILVNFSSKVHKTPKKWFLPPPTPVLKDVSSGLLSCIENYKIKLHWVFMLDLIGSHKNRLRPPKWWSSQDLCTPLSRSKPSRIPVFEELEFSVWNVLSTFLTPYSPWHLWHFVTSFTPLNSLCLSQVFMFGSVSPSGILSCKV